jgi:hypothetical protein
VLPLVISTKTMRATLLASATAVRLNLYLTVLRSSIPLAHRRKAARGSLPAVTAR